MPRTTPFPFRFFLLNSPPKIPFFFFSGCFELPASLGAAEVVIDDEDLETGGVGIDGFPDIALVDDTRVFVSVVPAPPVEKLDFSADVEVGFIDFS